MNSPCSIFTLLTFINHNNAINNFPDNSWKLKPLPIKNKSNYQPIRISSYNSKDVTIFSQGFDARENP